MVQMTFEVRGDRIIIARVPLDDAPAIPAVQDHFLLYDPRTGREIATHVIAVQVSDGEYVVTLERT